MSDLGSIIKNGILVPVSVLSLAPQESVSLVVVFTPHNYLTEEANGRNP
jgi:hypothetical protein